MVDRLGQHLPSLNWHEFTDFKKSLCRLIFATLKASWVARCWRSSVLLQKRTARWVLYLWDLVLHWFSFWLSHIFRVSYCCCYIYIYTPWKFVSRIFLSFNSSGKLWKLIAVSMDWRRASRPRPPLSEAENHRNLSLNMSLSIGTVAPSKRKGTRFFTPRIPSFKQCTF